MKENVLFFTYTEFANFCDGVVGSSSFHNIPVDVERDIVFDEFPDIFTFTNCFQMYFFYFFCVVRCRGNSLLYLDPTEYGAVYNLYI